MNRSPRHAPWRQAIVAASALLLVAACSNSGSSATPAGTSAVSSAPSASTGSAEGPIKIGMVIEITGEGASLGVPMRDAAQLAVDQLPDGAVNGRDVELVVLDNQSKEDVTAQVVNRLITEEKVDVIIGPGRSGSALAVRSIAEDNKIPMIALGANARITDGATWVFKTVVNTNDVLANMIDLAVEHGWKSLSVLRDASGFGEGVTEQLTALAEPQGIKIVTDEKFDPTTTDFTPHMLKLRQADADANIIWGIPPAVALAQKAYVELGLTAPVMQSHGIGNKVFLETAGAAANGVLSPLGRLLVYDQLPANDPQKGVIDAFVAGYSQAYGSTPSSFAGNAYDAVNLAVDAFKAVGTDKQAVRDHIEGLQDFHGVTGTFSFSPSNHSGLDKHAMAIVSVKDGAWVLVDDNRD